MMPWYVDTQNDHATLRPKRSLPMAAKGSASKQFVVAVGGPGHWWRFARTCTALCEPIIRPDRKKRMGGCNIVDLTWVDITSRHRFNNFTGKRTFSRRVSLKGQSKSFQCLQIFVTSVEKINKLSLLSGHSKTFPCLQIIFTGGVKIDGLKFIYAATLTRKTQR